MMMRPYEYLTSLRLREIRLLSLQRPASNSEDVRCDLEVVSLDDNPNFTAMSYHWGDPSNRKDIILSGKKFAVTVNLYNALRTWRGSFWNIIPDKPLRLWVDAVCINQRDTPERNRQVTMMGDIYASCSVVWIWLGEETEELHGSLDFVRKTCFKVFEDDFEEESDSKLQLIDAILEIDWKPLAALLQKPWFTRKWVIQEIVKASKATLWTGTKDIDWSELTILLRVIHRREYNLVIPDFQVDTVHIGFGNAVTMIEYRDLFSKQAFDIDALMRACAAFRATDLRDHLYALLGMTTNSADPMLAPEYSMPFEDVCKRFAQWHLQKKSLKFLSGKFNTGDPESQPPVLPNLPTWAPRLDWYASSLESVHFFCASKSRGFEGSASADLAHLQIKGIKLDQIAALIDSNLTWLLRLTPTDGEINRNQNLQTTLQQCKALALGPHTAQHVFTPGEFEAFWRTMLCDKDTNTEFRAKPELGHLFSRFMALLEGPDPPRTFADLTPDQSHELASLLAVLNATLRFCKTKNGWLGQCQPGSKVGDVVCVFFGAPTPYVIRPRPKGDGGETITLEFVGECYIHGVMYGEALDMGLEEEMFVLV